MYLTADKRASLTRDGYLFLPAVFSKDELHVQREVAQQVNTGETLE